MNCIVINEINGSRKLINKLLSDFAAINICGEFVNPEEAFYFLKNNKIELIFSSSIYAEYLEKAVVTIPILLYTTKKTFSIKSKSNNIVDYISLPCSADRFNSAINKAIDSIKLSGSSDVADYFYIRSNAKIIKLFKKDISYILASGNFLKIITPQHQYQVHETLTELEEKLFPFKLFGIKNTYFPSNKTLNDSTVQISKYYIKKTEELKDKHVA